MTDSLGIILMFLLGYCVSIGTTGFKASRKDSDLAVETTKLRNAREQREYELARAAISAGLVQQAITYIAGYEIEAETGDLHPYYHTQVAWVKPEQKEQQA